MPFLRALVPSALLLLPLAACAAEPDEGRGGADGEVRTASPTPRTSLSTPTSATPTANADPVEAALDAGPVRARTADEVAAQLVAAERALADPAASSERIAAAGHVQQLAYRVLGAHPEWDAAVRAAVPASQRPLVEGNVASRRAFRSMHRTLSDRLPAWRIVAPAPADELRAAYAEAERRSGVGWEYLAAINLVETGMGRIRGTSVAGAQGPMQFLPSTWEIYGEGDINSPRDAILAAGRFLERHGFNTPGGPAKALFRYNNSSAYVRGVTRIAQVMEREPRAFLGYYHWQIYYLTTKGDVLLPEGYASRRPIPVEEWLAAHPQA